LVKTGAYVIAGSPLFALSTDKAEMEAEVIDVRCLATLDIDTILESARKTTRVVIVEEDN
jgi:pyruvate/2-oxoglutarate/acetoin dehydrogenase E1 component